MAVDVVSFGGWATNLRLSNARVELIATIEVGPRIISFRTLDGENVLKTFDDQLGGTGEAKWKARGGHRFWLAPEDRVLSYLPDNSPVQHRVLSDYEIELVNPPTAELPVTKSMRVSLAPDSSTVTVRHHAENAGIDSRMLGTWGLTVMAPGGVEIIPLPALGEHPRDLLPNRNLILWPYTDMSDARWQWGERFIMLRQGAGSPTKAGLTHRGGWAAYARAGSLFVKELEFDSTATYPDGGCNFETFTNDEMLEVEALGPLVRLAPGEGTGHTEVWHLLDQVGPPPDAHDEIPGWIAPLLERAGINWPLY